MQTIITPGSITVVIDGEPRIVTTSDKLFYAIKDAVQRKADESEILELLNPQALIAKYSGGRVEVSDGKVYLDGEETHAFVSTRILDMIADGFDPEPLTNFLVKIKNNPSYRTRRDLYQFLEYGGLALFADGDFTAYKYIREDYTDCFTGKFRHDVGAILEMPRSDCDDDPTITCSAGLHFCSFSYLPSYSQGRRVVQLKINPADVVAIPVDYNNTKGRACRYQVFKELERKECETDTLRRSVVGQEAKKSYRVSSIELDFWSQAVDLDTPDSETVLRLSAEGLTLCELPDSYYGDDVKLGEDGYIVVENGVNQAVLSEPKDYNRFDPSLVSTEVCPSGSLVLTYAEWAIASIDKGTGALTLYGFIDNEEVPFPVDEEGKIQINYSAW